MRIETLDNRKLTLDNDGRLELFFIGVGSAFSKKLFQTNLLLIKGNDHLLIDCGTKCTQALHELEMPATNLKHFLITHSHADHIGGLEEIALMGRYATKIKPVMIINKTFQHILWDKSLKGGSAYNEEKSGRTLRFTDYWDIIRPEPIENYPRETFQAKVGSIDIKMVRTKHIPDSSPDWPSSFWSCGVIIDDKILFTSDTRYDEDLIKSFDKKFNFSAIIHDAQFFTGGVHASIDELNQLPAKIKKKIYLTHYGDNWEQFEDKVLQYGFHGFAKQHVFYVAE